MDAVAMQFAPAETVAFLHLATGGLFGDTTVTNTFEPAIWLAVPAPPQLSFTVSFTE